jgi:hypothetical protein
MAGRVDLTVVDKKVTQLSRPENGCANTGREGTFLLLPDYELHDPVAAILLQTFHNGYVFDHELTNFFKACVERGRRGCG